ncbi:MAG: MFS transporter [Candidatus Hodarchaeales archaeon]|jgi:MFS family permease
MSKDNFLFHLSSHIFRAFTTDEILFGIYHFPMALTAPFISWYFFKISGENFWGAGLIISVPYIFFIFSTGFFGKLSDLFGSKNIVIVSLVTSTLSFLSYYFIQNSLTFFFVYIFFNLLISGFLPSFNRLMSFQKNNRHRAEKFGRLGMIASVGFLLGSILASFTIVSIESFRFMFLIAAGVSFITLLLAFNLKEKKKPRELITESSKTEWSQNEKSMVMNVSIILIIFALTQVTNSVFINFFAIFIEKELNEPVTWVAIVNSIATFLGIIATNFIGKIVYIYKKKKLILLAVGLYTIVPLFTYIINNSILILALYCIPVYAILFVLIPVYISENTSNLRRGQAMGLYSSSQYVGQAVGTITGAGISSITGLVRPNFLLATLIGSVSILVTIFFFNEEK